MTSLNNLKPTPRIYPCKIRKIANDLSKHVGWQDQEIFMGAISDTTNWTALGLQRQLAEKGISVSHKTIKRHRAGTCSCSKMHNVPTV